MLCIFFNESSGQTQGNNVQQKEMEQGLLHPFLVILVK